MNVKVLSIKPARKSNCHEVLLSIGGERQVFKFTTEVNRVGDRLLQTTWGEERFSDVFRLDRRVAMNVSQLVVKFYNKEAIELPADVGNFVTPEEAVSNLRQFRKPETEDASIERGQTEEMELDTRHKAIALIEQLPESLLDDAVEALESLIVLANNLE